MSINQSDLDAYGRSMGAPISDQGVASTRHPGLGAWAAAISADDNAQAAIALAEALNRARQQRVGRDARAADARVISVGRLETLRARLAPIYAAIPRDVELFDLGLVGHTPPRLFVDIIAFIEMAGDGRTFRLVQETRNGRVTLGESSDEGGMCALVTDYIAVRLVERERAMAAQAVRLPKEALPKAPVFQVPEPPQPQAPLSVIAPAEEHAADPAPQPPEPASGLPVSDATAAKQPMSAAESGAMLRRPVTIQRQGRGGWMWPLLALLIGAGCGALALYLYALGLNRS